MPTQAWQSIRSTNQGILVESAHYTKAFQNDLNSAVQTPMTWNLGANSNTITNHTQPNINQFILPRGYFMVNVQLEVFSPTSAKLQYAITYQVNAVLGPEVGYSAILIATDYAHTDFFLHLDSPANGTVLEFFGQQAGGGGTIETTAGALTIVRLSNFL